MNAYNYKARPKQRDTEFEFQQVSTVARDVETTVLSFTNTGNKLYIEGIGGTGTAGSEWFIYLNTSLVAKRRMSSAYPFIEIPMYDAGLENGEIVDVKVKHFNPKTHDFDAEVRYFR